ncbi:Alpha-humulene synthase [Apostasia shenzhenica]|uniref:Alpha-humulene synthase n=1 Tax=Apostasia shenzhenica TaxID=1088818 RepID=A0A2I0AH40_9ASPA|nr:Alpha-humulene synthase [Apostasia shenzhenica]
MLLNGDEIKNLKVKIELIAAIERLGVDYHFEKEIEGLLKGIYDHSLIDADDLYLVFLQFRLLRQHGYNITSDVFDKFRDDERKFKGDLVNDVKGLLSLYEACYLATHEDGLIMDEALSFTKHHLQALSMEGSLDGALKALVLHALETPLHRRTQRVEARHYIGLYEHDKEQRNDLLLELAKLDFHLLQLLHYEEAKILTLWWEALGLAEKFSTFTRNRIIECYFWILCVYSEPHYSRARIMAAKVIALLSISDDFYDVYGTLEELQGLTDVIQRWDVEAANRLNDYMRITLNVWNDTFNEFEEELSSDQKSYRVNYIKEMLKVISRAWLQETKWRDEEYIPPLKEHLEVSGVTTCYNIVSCASYLGMDDVATKEVFDWMLTFPKYVHHACMICRIVDDIRSHEFEQKRNHFASTVQSYMKEHEVSVDQACNALFKIVDDEWKSLNQEFLNSISKYPRAILNKVVNYVRFLDTIYQRHDRYTHASLIKNCISMLLFDPIQL